MAPTEEVAPTVEEKARKKRKAGEAAEGRDRKRKKE